MFKELKDYEEMKEVVSSNKYVVVSVRPRGGCKICEIYAPHFKKAMEDILASRDDVLVTILPLDQECIEALDVCSPTVIFFKDGVEVSRLIVERVPVNNFENELKKRVNELFRG